MTFWLNKRTQEPVIPISSEQYNKIQDDGQVNIVFYGDLSSPKATILSKIAAQDDYNSTLLS